MVVESMILRRFTHSSVPLAVRGKFSLVGLIKVAIDLLKELFRQSGIGVGQGTALRNGFYPDMVQLTDFRCHGSLYLTKGIEPHCHGIEHCQKMREAVEALYIPLTAHIAADLNNFCLVKQLCQLSIYRLSEKMCILAHGYTFKCGDSKITKRAELPNRCSALTFLQKLNVYWTVVINIRWCVMVGCLFNWK